MKILQATISFFVLAFLIGCTDSTTQPNSDTFKLGDTLLLNYKKTLLNDENDISISFENLISDSRCPTDMRCFWEGDAEIEFKFRKELNTVYFNLHTARAYFNSDTFILGSYIKLIDVLPYTHSEIHYEAKDYLVKVVIE